jgi:protein-tyrosine phosphatase
MAEAVFQKMVDDAGLGDKITVDSAGTGSWHIGEPAHQGTRHVLTSRGIPYDGRARQVKPEDMADPNNYVIGMDDTNLRDLQRVFGDHPRLFRLLDFASQSETRNVPDPYYTGKFDYVYQLVEDGCQGLLAMIRRNEAL